MKNIEWLNVTSSLRKDDVKIWPDSHEQVGNEQREMSRVTAFDVYWREEAKKTRKRFRPDGDMWSCRSKSCGVWTCLRKSWMIRSQHHRKRISSMFFRQFHILMKQREGRRGQKGRGGRKGEKGKKRGRTGEEKVRTGRRKGVKNGGEKRWGVTGGRKGEEKERGKWRRWRREGTGGERWGGVVGVGEGKKWEGKRGEGRKKGEGEKAEGKIRGGKKRRGEKKERGEKGEGRKRRGEKKEREKGGGENGGEKMGEIKKRREKKGKT